MSAVSKTLVYEVTVEVLLQGVSCIDKDLVYVSLYSSASERGCLLEAGKTL